MSPLPQRKKSAEEIAKLRESLGIGGPPPGAAEAPAPAAPAVESPKPAKQAPEPVAPVEKVAEEAHLPKQVHSLKRSERIPGLPEEDLEPHVTVIDPVKPAATQVAAAEPVLSVEPVAQSQKIVRSLRKSEQGPVPVAKPPKPDSNLPLHRHSDEEIQKIRIQETLALQSAANHLLAQRAHPVLVVPGYLCVLVAAVGFYFYDLERTIVGACVGLALLIAAFIFFRKPLSVHHAAFIAVSSLFVIVFGALHYFPQLQHGT